MNMFLIAVPDEFERMLDKSLEALDCFRGAKEKRLAPLLPENFVLAANYMKSFPQHAFIAQNDLSGKGRYLLSPTCCYPVFHEMAGSRVDGDVLITSKNTCFRCEPYYETGTRQLAYRMREFIFLSESLERIQEWIGNVKGDVKDFLGGLGLSAEVTAASDPFFNANDYKEKIQREQGLKSEFIVEDIAVGSVNLHLKAFSRACAILSAGGKEIYSGCFGLGYDRVYEKVRRKADDGKVKQQTSEEV